MKLHRVMFPLCLAASTASVRAAPARDAIRVTIDGQTRVTRTVGHPTDPEFYAPLAKPLRSLWLDVQPEGPGEVEVRYQGNRVARWPVVNSEGQLPSEPGRPTVLREGDELLVPVKALVALGNGWVDWDDRTRTLTLTPTVRRLELRQGDRGLEVQIEASAPVRVTSVHLSHPSRLAIDITPAWFHIDSTPAPTGVVRSVRLGQFTKETARVVMELSQGPVRVTGLPQSATVITARLQPGAEIARVPEPAAAAEPAGALQPPSDVSPVTPAPRLRGHRLTIHRGLASRGGFIRRDPEMIGEPGGGALAGALAGKVICIDAGHGGWKSGASGLNGLKEGDACLAMAKQLERALQESGATVIMPREDDSYVSLEDRYTFANLKRADLFISIHCNAMQKHNTMSGTETYYWSPQSLDLARAVHPEAVQAMGGRDGGIRRRAFAVIHHTTMPSILIEAGYIDNVNDEAKLGDPTFQETFGSAVRDGILRYFGG
jgi:N-acetylmuramoyl-L-alanine amidase